MQRPNARRLAPLAALAIVVIVALAIAGCAPVEQTYPILNSVVVTADLVRGAPQGGPPLGPICAYTGQFQRGEEVVARVKILDPKTDKYLTDKDVKSVTFKLKDGTTVAMHYGPHPAPPQPATDNFWATGWVIPNDYPTGGTNWSVETVTNDGRSGTYSPPNVTASALTILDRAAGK